MAGDRLGENKWGSPAELPKAKIQSGGGWVLGSGAKGAEAYQKEERGMKNGKDD